MRTTVNYIRDIVTPTRAPPRVPQEALQCVQEMNSAQLLFVFVRNGLESTLERSTIVRERIGLLLQQLVKSNVLQRQQYYTGSAFSLLTTRGRLLWLYRSLCFMC